MPNNTLQRTNGASWPHRACMYVCAGRCGTGNVPGRRAGSLDSMKTAAPKIDERFSNDLLSEDELGAVVRAHIHIEATIREFIDHRMKLPSYLGKLTPTTVKGLFSKLPEKTRRSQP